jgi:hypothetical protein
MTVNGKSPLLERIEEIQASGAHRQPAVLDDPVPEAARPQSVRPLSYGVDDVHEEPVRWIWKQRIALGKLTVLDGWPGVGKSTIVAELAARITSGSPMPDGSRSDLASPATVLLASGEDGLADTILPRFLAAGGRRDRLRMLRDVPGPPTSLAESEPFAIPKHLQRLRTEIKRFAVRLVCFDPLSDFLGADVNFRDEQSMRQALSPLRTIAEETDCAVLLVRHLTKSGGSDPLTRGTGAISVVGIARGGLLVARDPSDPNDKRCVLVGFKSNLGAKAPALTYEIGRNDHHRCSVVVWGEASTLQASDLLATPADSEERSVRSQIADQLWLATVDGPILCSYAFEAIASAGFNVSTKTIRRAAGDAGLDSETTKTFPGMHYWKRPGQSLPSVDTGPSGESSPKPVPTDLTRDHGPETSSMDGTAALSILDDAAAPEVAP